MLITVGLVALGLFVLSLFFTRSMGSGSVGTGGSDAEIFEESPGGLGQDGVADSHDLGRRGAQDDAFSRKSMSPAPSRSVPTDEPLTYWERFWDIIQKFSALTGILAFLMQVAEWSGFVNLGI